MNCKPGDLAIVHSLVIDLSSNDMFVDCLAWVPSNSDYLDPDGFVHYNESGVAMACKSIGRPFALFTRSGECSSSYYTIFHPKNLRPIRNQPGQDETLTWAPVPGEKVTA